jgi:3',5'-cyclic AMP phosphodiesterase CpdA
VIPLGQYPAPAHTIAHISDTHFLGQGRKLYGVVETEANLRQALTQLKRLSGKPEAIVVTGDLADLGEPDAYDRLRSIVEPVAAELGAQLIWVMGNHDERGPYNVGLFDGEQTDQPQDRVYDVNGLRVISLDSTVPGYHHGELSDTQLEWLAAELATPAPGGTILALHHPPVPTPLLWAMEMLELHGQSRLAAVLEGSDVRAILAGHLHYSSFSTFAGIPVSVASATCYTLALAAEDRLLSGNNENQAFNMVHLYENSVVHSIVPLGDETEVSGFATEYAEQIIAMSPEQRLEMFSSKNSPFNSAEAASSD